MGYAVTKQEGSKLCKIVQANAPFAQFENVEEVLDYLEDEYKHYIEMILDFDNEKTAKAILSNFRIHGYEGGLRVNPRYWEYFPVEGFESGIISRKYLYNDYYKLREYFTKEQNVAALNALIDYSDIPAMGRITNVSKIPKNGEDVTVEFKNGDKIMEAVV